MGTTNHDDSVATGSSSGDGVTSTDVMIDDGDNSFSFYEIWNHEILVLKSAIDERIQSITERSQKEIERIAATVTGISAPAPYKIKTVGPKIPPRQWSAHRAMMKQQYQQQQLEQQQQQQQQLQKTEISSSSFSPFNSIEPRSRSCIDGKTNNKSTKHRDIRLSPSGRSQTTATSDKTIPQSNVSSRQKQPNTIMNVLSIPEETSLQQTTEEENENDDHETMNEDDDENSESCHSSSSETSSVPNASPVVDKQSSLFLDQIQKDVDADVEDQPIQNDEEENEVILEDKSSHPQLSGSIEEYSRDIPSMIASLSLSSASQSEAGRQSRPLVGGRRPKNFYPWLVERVQPQSGQQRDAPTEPTNGQFRPDAPAHSDSKGESKNVIDSAAATSVFAEETKIELETLEFTQDNAAAKNDTISSKNLVMDDHKSGNSETERASDNCKCLAQPFIETLTSLPSIEETLPSLTDKEISAIFRTEADTKSLDGDGNNSFDKKGCQQRKHRKPPSPETFVMSGKRKVKRKKVSKSPTKGDSKGDTQTDTQIALLDSIEESTVDTFSKIEDKETATEAPSTDIISYNNERRIQPHEGAVEPSLVRLEYVTEKKIKDPYNDEGIYTGILILGKPETHGTMKYDDGRYYTGSWKRGRWNGHGKAIFANGDTYTGDYVHDQRHGVGRYEWSDARVYDGRFNNDQREGHGTYSWPNGSVYCGDFHLGLRHGYGTYTYEDGSVYSGEWLNGKQHGNGECIWADGRCFRGEWLNGHTRAGVETRADGSIRHDGVWRKNRPVRPNDRGKKHNQVQQHPSNEIRLRKSFESDQSSKLNLKYLREGKSLVRNVSDTSYNMEASTNSKLGVTGIVSASMSE